MPISEAEAQNSNDAPSLIDQFSPASAATGQGEPCNLTAALASDLAQSKLARTGLDRLAKSDHSVADAVMLWDGAWPTDAESDGKALLKGLVLREVLAASPECRTQINRGPLLFLAPGPHTTYTIAVGSGLWRWADLLN